MPAKRKRSRATPGPQPELELRVVHAGIAFLSNRGPGEPGHDVARDAECRKCGADLSRIPHASSCACPTCGETFTQSISIKVSSGRGGGGGGGGLTHMGERLISTSQIQARYGIAASTVHTWKDSNPRLLQAAVRFERKLWFPESIIMPYIGRHKRRK